MFEQITPESIQAGMLDYIAGQPNAPATGEGSFAANLAMGAALEIWKVLRGLDGLVPIAYVDESSGGYIDLEAEKMGITRKPGTRASAVMHLVGKAGETIPKGTQFCAGPGLVFSSEEAVALGPDGTATVTVLAAAEGADYNVDAGAIDRMYVNLAALTSHTNEAAQGGTDQESDQALFARLDARRKRPATSGNRYHYEQWALEVPGVGAVKVTPRVSGPGTVGVMVADSNKAPASAEIVQAVAAHIEAERPVDVLVQVAAPQALEVAVAAAVTIDGTTTREAVARQLEEAVGGYVEGLVFQGSTLLYNRVAFLLLSIPGVQDYTALTLNGGEANLVIPEGSVPVLGEVAVT